MSSSYVTEPPTKGKVILKTTLGDLEIELWPKEAPKAVRNFVQLCMEGFYHGTIFHRIISGFMAQGGDPTGSGTGSDSIYGGRPFEDEFHSRLRFTHRGLLACANQNSPHTNSCQFFITLDACEFLNRKNTIFGKVVGDTIYNVQRMNELETDEGDRPVDPPVITDVDVVWNPFEDIVPRTTIEERRAAKEKDERKPKKKKAKKALNLLSFGDDAAEDEQELASMGGAGKIKSAHDTIEDARFLRDDDAEAKRMLEEEEEEHEKRKARNAVRDALRRKADEEAAGGHSTMEERLRAKVQQSKAASKAEAAAREEEEVGEVQEGAAEEEEEESEKAARKRKQREFRQQLRDRAEDLADKRGAAPRRPQQRVENAELLTAWQRSRAEYKQKKRLTGAREKETLAKLQKFRAKVVSAAATATEEAPADGAPTQEKGKGPGGDGGPEGEDGYDGRVRQDIDHRAYMPAAWRIDDYLALDDDDGDAGIESLRSHKLVFAKAKGTDEMARVDNLDDYVVHDPLVEKQKAKFNKVQQRNKKMQNEWAGRSMT